ncbi:uncharacterized protein LOC144153372 [Haemaphysalis longicornis]
MEDALITAASGFGSVGALFYPFLASSYCFPTDRWEYKDFAVVCDAKLCADVAKRIYDKGSRIGDIMVAALLCMGVTAPHLAGLAGSFMALYDHAKDIVPRDYRVQCRGIKYTRHIGRILDECSYRIMLADLDYSRVLHVLLRRSLVDLNGKLANILFPKDMSRMAYLAKAKYAKTFMRISCLTDI